VADSRCPDLMRTLSFRNSKPRISRTASLRSLRDGIRRCQERSMPCRQVGTDGVAAPPRAPVPVMVISFAFQSEAFLRQQGGADPHVGRGGGAPAPPPR
jgi:hypothetical protein